MEDRSSFPVCVPSGRLFDDMIVVHAKRIFMANPIQNEIDAVLGWAILGFGIKPERPPIYAVSVG
jgi:hypothetical protein